jgi:hypothetical protein
VSLPSLNRHAKRVELNAFTSPQFIEWLEGHLSKRLPARLIDFRLPETFHPGEFLRRPQLRNCHDDARYFVSLILTKLARRQVDECATSD